MKKSLIVFLFAAFVVVGCEKQNIVIQTTPINTDNLRIQAEKTLVQDTGNEDDELSEMGALISVIPSKHIAEEEIDTYYKMTSAQTEPSVVVVLAPDRTKTPAENGLFFTCKNCSFESPYGVVSVDENLTNKFLDLKGTQSLGTEFAEEVDISFHANYIRKYFGPAKIFPITVSKYAAADDIVRISSWLNSNLPEDAVVIGSVNFSASSVPEIAELHNNTVQNSISNMDYAHLKNTDIDSPVLLELIMRLAEYRNSQTPSFIGEIVSFADEEEFEPLNDVSFLVVGDMPDENSIPFTSGWNFTDEDTEIFKYLKNIRGVDTDFLSGVDYLVFDLPENECRLEKHYSKNILLCEFAQSMDTDEIDDEVERITGSVDVDLYFMVGKIGGKDEISEESEDFLKYLADYGRSIVVGRGFNGILPMKKYGDSLIFYSLGDFLTNGRMANSLDSNSEGVVLAITLSDESYKVYTFPIEILKGYPSFKNTTDRSDFLKEFVTNISNTDIEEEDYDRGTLIIDK